MTTLRDPFANVHKKDIKNKAGQVVAQVDYVGWSQSADRLDDAVPDAWSFSIMGIGEDWVHGRLTIGDRHFENIGYAENADMDWKKEVLKDAASDAFKRCAALAGVARYLYDKDAPRQTSPASSGRAAPAPPARPSAPTTPPDLEDPTLDAPPVWEEVVTPVIRVRDNGVQPQAGVMWSKALFEAAEAAGIDKRAISDTSKRLFGKDKWKVTELTDGERWTLAYELGLVAA